MDGLAQLGIDFWSIFIYIVNTGVVLVALIYFLYRPILNTIDQRRKIIADSIEEANLLREEFTKKMEESEMERKKTETELKEEMANLQRFLEAKRIELIHEMETAKTEMMLKAEKEIEARKTTILKESEKEVMQMMTKIILDIVQNKVPEQVIQESIHESWVHYNR
ncbi:MAG: hypothetical protein ACD_28C00035G0012 [uncultured bacterium]|nr:MAG: hypothetical protein ACD_28C00035G0012 [uncultured bacterium]KKT72881.1 MAG: ATP synthase subunit b 1 [Candidatus Peregrinibacteria bacterium GW2011_GWA2_44_7]